MSSDPLRLLLQKRFGFAEFRPNQEAVCRTAVDGKDVLLVMPTGSGKSLCYQLPGLARGGTTLVISPLIALMEDQIAKLESLGFAVDRIHSGRDRTDSRAAAGAYLEGKLQFLFVAPERFRVSGFGQMLARRRPALIAIDEAHCISQWGHDFRPDYRMLGQHLPNLRPSPVMALTATATRIVQGDIVRQLGLLEPAEFIGGFRRDNIAIEVVEVAQVRRTEMVEQILQQASARPAIVYAPTRKLTEELAANLSSHHRAAAYHAGLTPDRRAHVQDRFLSGELEVIVATIAFGMGIDKPNVRTVIHTGLPGSIEGYYQEIGRAGRDGLPSRAILMQAYSDRRTHDFFFERDYPEVEILDRIFEQLGPRAMAKADLEEKAQAPTGEIFDKALEKLWTHGGALVDYAENVTRGAADWRPLYLAQSKHRQDQIELMLRYVAAHRCRMSAVVHYFGDVQGSRTACGVCDHCAPSLCVAQQFRSLLAWEKKALFQVLRHLQDSDGSTTGQLFKELAIEAGVERREFEELLGAMTRAGLVKLTSAVFEKDGKQIPYKKVWLTDIGRETDETTPVDIAMKTGIAAKPGKKREKAQTKTATTRVARPELMTRLKAWRLREAQELGVPAFRICTDKVLQAIAAEEPGDDAELLTIRGIGRHFVDKFGTQIYRLLNT